MDSEFGFAMSGRGGRRRSHVEVIVEILSEALNGANKTRLMYRCNLNFGRFNRYLRELCARKIDISKLKRYKTFLTLN